MVLADGRDEEKIATTFGLDRQASPADRDRCGLAWEGEWGGQKDQWWNVRINGGSLGLSFLVHKSLHFFTCTGMKFRTDSHCLQQILTSDELNSLLLFVYYLDILLF